MALQIVLVYLFIMLQAVLIMVMVLYSKKTILLGLVYILTLVILATILYSSQCLQPILMSPMMILFRILGMEIH